MLRLAGFYPGFKSLRAGILVSNRCAPARYQLENENNQC